MPIASTPEQQRAWMAQWRSAAVALEQVKAEELRALTPEQASRDADELLSLGPFSLLDDRKISSGLVEQQSWFQRLNPQS